MSRNEMQPERRAVSLTEGSVESTPAWGGDDTEGRHAHDSPLYRARLAPIT
jgi:hypothetical protein